MEPKELVERLLDDLLGAWRFRWIGVAIAAVVCAVGFVYVLSVPSIYEGRARVYVDTQSILRPLLQGLAIAPNVESDVSLVRQAMLSRPNLENVARKTGLMLNATSAKEQEALVTQLSSAIKVTAAAGVGGSVTDGVYTIAFQHASRDKSLAVVQSILNTFVEESLGNKRTGQEEAQRFLQEQIADYEKRLAASEQRLVAFKRENIGRMPDQRGDYFGRLQGETAALESARNDLALAEARRREIQRQLDGEDPFVFGLEGQLSAGPAPAETSDVTARILQLEKRREELLMRFTEKHPEVVGVERTLADLRATQAAELARLRQGRGTGVMAQSTKANPVYQSLKLELNRADVQIAELQRIVAQRSGAVAALRNVADTVPQVEADVARLTRDYEVTRAQYLALVQRLETAKLSEDADATGTVKFDVIDPPAVGLKPVAPKRPLLFTGVLFFALAVGAGVAYLLNMLRPVYRNSSSLTRELELPVIGTVGRVWAGDEADVRRRDGLRFAGAMGLLIVVFIVMTVVGERVAGAIFDSQA